MSSADALIAPLAPKEDKDYTSIHRMNGSTLTVHFEKLKIFADRPADGTTCPVYDTKDFTIGKG